MKKTILILFLCLSHYFNGYSVCAGDSRSFTEVLFQNKDITIFKCKILTTTKGFYTAQIIETYLGKVDGTNVKLKTSSSKTAAIFKTGDEVLVYTSGGGKQFNLNGTCDNLNKVISADAETQYELKLLEEFSDIFKNKKSGDFKFYFSNKTLAAEGKYEDGLPVGLWKHYYLNTRLKTEQDFETSSAKYYTEDGFISSYTKTSKDSTINLIYSNKINGNVSYKVVDVPNDSGFVSTSYEYYENKAVKLIQSLAYRVKGTNTLFSGIYGKYYEFYDTGKLKIQGNYLRSKRVGLWKYFDKTGKVISEFDYKDGSIKP